MRADYPGAALELRRFGSFDAWQRACEAPCDRGLVVSGMEARAVAPNMTPSKSFQLEAGTGTAMLSVNGGSASAARWGRTALLASLLPSFVGMGLVGYGTLEDRPALTTGGGIALGLGAALALTALPLLASGSTNVKNADGDLIGVAVRPTLY
jgi:hypothetical protein